MAEFPGSEGGAARAGRRSAMAVEDLQVEDLCFAGVSYSVPATGLAPKLS
jgi:hypothetical protein